MMPELCLLRSVNNKLFSYFVAYFMVVNMGITAVSLIATVVVLSIFYHDPSKPLPTWLRVLLNCLASATCSTGGNKIAGTTEVKPIMGNGLQQKADVKDQVKKRICFSTAICFNGILLTDGRERDRWAELQWQQSWLGKSSQSYWQILFLHDTVCNKCFNSVLIYWHQRWWMKVRNSYTCETAASEDWNI